MEDEHVHVPHGATGGRYFTAHERGAFGMSVRGESSATASTESTIGPEATLRHDPARAFRKDKGGVRIDVFGFF